MLRNRTLFTALFVIIFFPLNVAAQNDHFSDNEVDIINILSQPAPPKTVIKTRGLTRGFKVDDSSQSIDNSRTIVVMAEKENKIIQQTVLIQEGDNTPRVNMKIQFNYDSWELRPVAYSLLRELGNALTNQALAGKQISVLGHTDADGSDQYNLGLSLKRARSVKDYLVGNFNLSPSRIDIYGYGETLPLLPNSSSYNKQLNRRVEIRAE